MSDSPGMTDSYFSQTATGRAPDAHGSFARLDDQPILDAGGGVTFQVVPGASLLLSYVTMAPHGVAAVHAHDEEQMGLIVSGSGEMELDAVSCQLAAGDVYHAPPGVPHGIVAGPQGCVIVDLFSPPRRALLALLAQAEAATTR